MNKKIWLAVTLFCAVLLVFDSAQALRITLKRIVFEGSKRAEVITIINNTGEPQTYRLGWRHFRMTSDKSLVAVPNDQLTEDIKPVVDMVRFAPRRFTVEPNSSQQVRMMLRVPADLPDGEYRSHFWVHPEANIEKMRVDTKKKEKANGSAGGVSLTMLAGVTMPVIVRKGDLSVELFVEDLDAVESGGFISAQFTLNRIGDRSVYGDVDFVCNPDHGGYPLKSMRGIAVYAELNLRDFNVRIEKPLDKPHCSVLKVAFTPTDGLVGERQDILAQAQVAVR